MALGVPGAWARRLALLAHAPAADGGGGPLNFLAHLHLAGDEPETIVGQVMADFLERGWRDQAPPGVLRGIRLHQAIDRFTDTHPIAARSRRRIGDPFRLYAGIFVDVYYDHFLARYWSHYHPGETLEAFAERMYATLEAHQDGMTDRLRRALPAMRRYNWLASYRELGGIERALSGIGRRLRHENPMHRGGEPLRAAYEDYKRDFGEFFPTLVAYVEEISNAEPRAIV